MVVYVLVGGCYVELCGYGLVFVGYGFEVKFEFYCVKFF